MLADSVKLGIANLRHRQLRSWLTMIGIFIGIAAVVSLIALGSGLRAAITNQFSSLGTDRLVIEAKGAGFGPPGQGAAAKLTAADLDVVKHSNYVVAAAGRLLKAGQVEFNHKTKGEFIGSLPKDTQARAIVESVTNVDPLSGRWPSANDGFRAMIGFDYTKTDRFGKAVQVGDTLQVNGKKIEVVGILKSTGNPGFDQAIFMNEDAMRQLFNGTDEYSVLVATVDKPQDMDLAKQTIENNLRNSRHVKPRQEDFTVQTPSQLLGTVDTVLGGVTAVLVGIAMISLLVGGLGIMNTMYTAVLERTREIGIMKAVGAKNSDVLQIFLFESGMLGLAGACIGVLLGIGMSELVAAIGRAALGGNFLRADITWQLILAALAFGFIVGSLAGTLPAYEAAKMSPVEALQQ